MRFSPISGALLCGLAVALPGVILHAQGGVAVPIVGSPAAQQPQRPQPSPAAPVQAPQLPPTTAVPASQQMAANPGTPRKLDLSFDKGAVTLSAQNVTVREILAEWQRRNGCQFVNAEKLPGGPVTVPLEFSARPELEVIDALLRGVAGYMVGPRSDSAQSGSVCGVVYILPTSVATTAVSSYTPSSPTPLAVPLLRPGTPDDEIPPVAVPINPPQQIPPRAGQPNPAAGPGQDPGQAPQPPPGQIGGFAPVPVTPTAPGAGRVGGPPTTTPAPTGGGRGGLLP